MGPVLSVTHRGMTSSAGLAGCWIIEVSLYGKINDLRQRILAGTGDLMVK